MYLADTNIFLEILLDQQKASLCREFLEAHPHDLYLSDFTLHSIGVILFRTNRPALFSAFVEDIVDRVSLLSLPTSSYVGLASVCEAHNLDFDDAYQLQVSRDFDLTLVTMDRDFTRAADAGDRVQFF